MSVTYETCVARFRMGEEEELAYNLLYIIILDPFFFES